MTWDVLVGKRLEKCVIPGQLMFFGFPTKRATHLHLCLHRPKVGPMTSPIRARVIVPTSQIFFAPMVSREYFSAMVSRRSRCSGLEYTIQRVLRLFSAAVYRLYHSLTVHGSSPLERTELRTFSKTRRPNHHTIATIQSANNSTATCVDLVASGGERSMTSSFNEAGLRACTAHRCRTHAIVLDQ